LLSGERGRIPQWEHKPPGRESRKVQDVRGDKANPVAINVVQAEMMAEGCKGGWPGFDSICYISEDASNLNSLIIIGGSESIVVDADRDVDDVIHGSNVCRGDLNDVEVRIVLFDMQDAVIQIDAFFDRHKLKLLGLPVLKDQVKGQHGLIRTRWREGESLRGAGAPGRES